MKRCPTCNQTFEEDWLTFCIQDGTTLIEDQGPSEPPPTIMAPTPAEPAKENELATWNLPASDVGVSLPTPSEPNTAQAFWQPPPPPTYVQPPSRSLSTAAMVLGIISATVGWLCFGPLPGIAAIILGAVALSQIRKNPEHVAGKQAAWIGIIAGGLTVVIYAGLIVVYIVIAIMGMNS